MSNSEVRLPKKGFKLQLLEQALIVNMLKWLESLTQNDCLAVRSWAKQVPAGRWFEVVSRIRAKSCGNLNEQTFTFRSDWATYSGYTGSTPRDDWG